MVFEKGKGFRKANGITLVALSVTILLLVILVSVTVKIAIDNGLIGNTKIIAESYERQQARERLLVLLEEQKIKNVQNKIRDKEDRLNSIDNLKNKDGVTDVTRDGDTVKVIIDGEEFVVDENLQIVNPDNQKPDSNTTNNTNTSTENNTTVDPGTEVAYYTITYYTENLESGYTEYRTERKTETIGRQVVADEIEIEGFELDSKNQNNKLTGKIVADGSLTLKAYYTRKSYTITFTEGENTEKRVRRFEEKLGELPEVVKEGYTLVGWYDAEGNQVTAMTKTPAKNLNLTARLDANQYTIQYDGNGATSGNVSNSNHTYGVASHLNTNEYQKEYVLTYELNGGEGETNKTIMYGFAGWKTEPAGISAIYENEQRIINLTSKDKEMITLYAHWEGGEIVLPEPTKIGYRFVGWYSDSELNQLAGNAGDTYFVGNSHTLFAKWEANTEAYQVEYYKENLESTDPNNPENYTKVEEDTDRTRTGLVGDSVQLQESDKTKYLGFAYQPTVSTESSTLSGNGNIVLKAYYARKTDIDYNVEFYQENIDSKDSSNPANYTKIETETRKGRTGNTVNLTSGDKIKYEGFQFNSAISTTTVTIDEDGSSVLAAYYTRKSYQVYSNILPSHSGQITGLKEYKYGEEVNLIATANEGYTFVEWKGIEEIGLTTTTNAAISFVMPAKEVTVTAQFAVNQYEVTVKNNPEAAGEVTGVGNYDYGEEVTLTAIEKEGYTFVEWEVPEGVNITTTEENPKVATFKMPASDVEITANYQVNQYTVETEVIPANAGSVTGADIYDYQSEVSLTATVEAGYHFIGWEASEGVVLSSSTELTTTFVMPAKNVMIKAKFEANEYMVNTSVEPEVAGEVTGAGNYRYQSEVSLTATAKEGYHFVGWEAPEGVTLSSTTEETTTFVMPAKEVTIKAKFEANEYMVNTSVEPEVAGEVTGAGNYRYQSEVTLTASAAEGYHFIGWEAPEGLALSSTTEETTTFVMPAKEVTIKAKFEANEYMVNTSVEPEVAGEVTGAGNYRYQSEVSLTASAAEGYHFVGWEAPEGVTLSSTTEETTTFVMPAKEVTIKAKFEANEYMVNTSVEPANAGSVTGAGNYRYQSEVSLTASAAEGYHFIGWEAPEGVTLSSTTEAITTFVMPAKEVTVKAKFEADEYTVTFDPQGGSVSPTSKTVTYGSAYGELPTPTRTGYTFGGWYTGENGTEDKIESTTIVSTANNHTLYANWRINQYHLDMNMVIDGTTYTNGYKRRVFAGLKVNNEDLGYIEDLSADYDYGTTWEVYGLQLDGQEVSYQANGMVEENGSTILIDLTTIYFEANEAEYGSVSSSEALVAKGSTINVHGEEVKLEDSNPERIRKITASKKEKTGYTTTFLNWSKKNSNTLTANFERTANTYTIIYDGNGETSGSMANSSHTYDIEKALNPNGYIKEGYSFGGWATTKEGSAQYTDEEVVKNLTAIDHATVTLYATWNIGSYTVTAKPSIETAGTIEGAGSYDYGEAVTLTATTNEGYTFNGWTAPEGIILSSTTDLTTTFTMPANNVSIIANYTANTYTVSATRTPSAGGTVTGTGSYTYEPNLEVTLRAISNTGYYFDGWTAPAEVSLSSATDPITTFTMPAKNVNITAKWKGNTYTVTFNPQGGSVSPTSKTVTYGENYGTLPTPTREGYTFGGWYTGTNGTGSQKLSGTKVATAGNHTLYAKWTANTYTVTYDKNATDATGSMVSSSHTYDIAKQLTANGYTKTGYHFAGWATEANGEVVYEDAENVINLANTNGATVTLYAKWAADTYTVTLNPKEGSVSPEFITVTYGSEYTNLPYPTRTGYVFTGWCNNENGDIGDDGENLVYQETKVTTASNHTLYANWIAGIYQLYFDAQGGTVNISGNTPVIYDETYGELPTPTKEGYDFKGWYTGTNGTGSKIESNTTVKITDDTTLYAYWEEIPEYTLTVEPDGDIITQRRDTKVTVSAPRVTRTIRYVTNGGEAISDSSHNATWISWDLTGGGSIESNTNPAEYTFKDADGTLTATYDMSHQELPTPTKTGYTFNGWYYNSGLTDSVQNNEVWFAGDEDETITVYAKWTPSTYTVTFDPNGGSVSPTSKTVTYNSVYGELPTPTRTGYVFNGWYTEKTGGELIDRNGNEQVKKAYNHTLYAHWTAKTYTVTFNPNGGSVSPTSKTVTYNLAYGSMPTPTREGYDFIGWYTSTSGGEKRESNTVVKTTGNHTLYAHWSAKTYVVRYNAINNGGKMRAYNITNNGVFYSGGPTDEYYYQESYLEQLINYNTNISLFSTIQAQKTGYEFVGWNTDPNATTALENYQVKGNVTLFAIYRKSVTATFIDYNGSSKTTRYVTTDFYNNSNSESIKTPSINSYTGWTASGWTTGTSNSSTVTASSGGMTSITESGQNTFYALYTKKLSAKFIYYDGRSKMTATPASGTGTIKTNSYNISNTTTVAVKALPISAYKDENGYTWTARYWTSGEEATATQTVGSSGTLNLTVNGPTTFYARYYTTVTVSFNVNGGTGSVSSISKTLETNSSVITDVANNVFTMPNYTGTKSGYGFAGWNTNSSGTGTTYQVGEDFQYKVGTIGNFTSKSITLYAKWISSSNNNYAIAVDNFDPNSSIIGDVNLDGYVTTYDANLITSEYAELIEFGPKAAKNADADVDGAVDMSDASAIIKHIGGTATSSNKITVPRYNILHKGSTIQLKLYKNVGQEMTSGVTWSTSYSSRATVDSTGLVTIKGTGQVTITAKYGSYSDKFYIEGINEKGSNAVFAIAVDESRPKSNIVGDVNLDGYISMYDAKLILQHTIQTGSLTGQAKTNADVDGDGGIALDDATCMIQYLIGKRTGIGNITMPYYQIVDQGALQLKVYNNGSVQSGVTWKSSNTNVATVDTTGKVTFKGAGHVTIIASYGSYADSFHIEYVMTNSSTCSIAVDESKSDSNIIGDVNLDGYVTRQDAVCVLHYGVTGESAIPTTQGRKNADVGGDGDISSGDGTYLLRYLAGYVTGIGKITVPRYNVESIGRTIQLKAYSNYNTLATGVTWRSTNSNVATVDANGKVTVVGKGHVMIVAAATDGTQDYFCIEGR